MADAKVTTELTGVYDYDLQAILILPAGNVSSFFYKSRLNNYNFTIFDTDKLLGYLFLWNENIGCKGAIEIASCVYKFIAEQCAAGMQHFIFYTDNCPSQNKNKFLVLMYLYVLKTIPSLLSICHNFLLLVILKIKVTVCTRLLSNKFVVH